MNEQILGQMQCPKCGNPIPTIPGPCPLCGYDPTKPQPQTPKRIYKYPVPLQFGVHEIMVPRKSTILKDTVIQNGTICFYGWVDPDQTEVATLQVGILPTGADIPDGAVFNTKHHFATKMSELTGLVYHIFVREKI